MQTMNSRLYTNAILTVIAVMLTVVAFREVFSVSTPAAAQARTTFGKAAEGEEDGDAGVAQYGVAGDTKVAAATQKVADSNKEIAAAIRESAAAQVEIAEALRDLGTAMTEPLEGE